MIAATWRKQAACRGLDVEAFYPVTEDEADAAEAKAVCAVCPVRQACLEHALAHRDRLTRGYVPSFGELGQWRYIATRMISLLADFDHREARVHDISQTGLCLIVDRLPPDNRDLWVGVKGTLPIVW